MENITREAILSAIQTIDTNPNLKKGRFSSTYDLVYDGEKYPPILVLSEANKVLGGEELLLSDFGTSTTKAFKYLTDNGFIVKTKKKEMAQIWFVCQGDSFSNEDGTKQLTSPKYTKNGRSKPYWDNMKRVKNGDIIFNYSKGIKGVSVAKSNGYSSDYAVGKEGYKVDIKFHEFDRKISIWEIMERKNDIDSSLMGVKHKPFTKDGKVNQGYLFELSKEAGKILISIYGKTTQSEYVDNYFNNIELFESGIDDIPNVSQVEFELYSFIEKLKESNLKFDDKLVKRFSSSLLTKPFIILSGLSGSGKTKLAQAFVQWICAEEEQYKIVPVGADWTSREPLLGYPNALDQNEYIKPDNGVVDLILHAVEHENLPHFLILDEMNLSHVERYFADFLSVMESNGKINFHSGEEKKSGVPASVVMPDNLFIIGTINVDETTYMFSPKVLDRANAIEFRISEEEIEQFLETPVKPDLKKLLSKGTGMAESFMAMVRVREFENPANGNLNKTLVDFFGELKKTGAEFGYRSAFEIHRLINQLTVIDIEMKDEEKLDIAIMQKLLPKLHGSRRKLCPVLVILGGFCVDKDKIKDIEKDVFNIEDFDFKTEGVLYPLALEKITRMHTGAVENGFASYAEA